MTVSSEIPDSPTGAPTEHSRTAARAGHQENHKAIALVLALTGGLSLSLALFVSVAVNSGPNGVRLAVAGPPTISRVFS